MRNYNEQKQVHFHEHAIRMREYSKAINTGCLDEIRKVYFDIHKNSCQRPLTYGEKYYKLQASEMIKHILK